MMMMTNVEYFFSFVEEEHEEDDGSNRQTIIRNRGKDSCVCMCKKIYVAKKKNIRINDNPPTSEVIHKKDENNKKK